jgi:hypothetical protein
MKQVEQRGKRAGQSLVEFALMLPLLLLLIANVVNFAGFYYGKRALEHHGVPFEPGLSVYLRAVCEHATNHLRGCYPNDICEILLAQASYRRQPIHLTRRTLGVAAEMYFTNTVPEKP